MTANILHEDSDQALNVAYKSRENLEWVVREDPKLQAELNKRSLPDEEINTKVVNKVLDRIKDL
jgi:hypothetical protein